MQYQCQGDYNVHVYYEKGTLQITELSLKPNDETNVYTKLPQLDSFQQWKQGQQKQETKKPTKQCS